MQPFRIEMSPWRNRRLHDHGFAFQAKGHGKKNFQKLRASRSAYEKKRLALCSWIMFTQIFCIPFEKRNKAIKILVFLQKPKLFCKMFFFPPKMLSLSNFGLDQGVCFVNAMILIKKKLMNLCRFSFNELLKCASTMILNIL